MRYLYYTNYQSGGSGLSNGIMSIDVLQFDEHGNLIDPGAERNPPGGAK